MKKLPFYDFQVNVIIRTMVGPVFLPEGIQKFLFADVDGVGRFLKIGIPSAMFMAPFVGVNEIVCGILLIIGLWVRLAAVPLLIVIPTAIYTTKIPMLMEKGFRAAAHEGRADFCMLPGLVFLLVYGAGRYSVDGRIMKDAVVRTLGRKILEEHDFRPNTGMLKASHVYSQTMYKRYYDAEGIVC